MRYFTDDTTVVRIDVELLTSPDFFTATAERYCPEQGWVADADLNATVLFNGAFVPVSAEHADALVASAAARPLVDPAQHLLPDELLTQLWHLTTRRDIGVTVLCGFPAVGKSTAAQYLSRRLGAVVLSKDTFASALEESVMAELTGNPHDRDSDRYREVIAPHLYSALVDHALTLGQRVPVIVDAPFLAHINDADARQISLAAHLTATRKAPAPPLRTVWLSATPAKIRQRMIRRAAPRDATKLADWQTYQREVLCSPVAQHGLRVTDYWVRT